ncbi:MAG: hypothetical protein KAW92_04085, partial [Candidatus Cloacimonetes bacterium]|nr:hypothetical protein [Candidatus Cloacimonadota bacterium]
MSKKTNSFIILTIILGSAFLMPTNVFATEIFPGTALEFDGTDDYISTTLMDLSGSEITIEYWFKGSSTQSAVRQQTAGDNFIVSGWSDLHILSNDGGVAGGLSIGASAEDGNWHHIAFTWKQNTTDGFVSYLDGQIVASRTSSDIPIPNHNTNLIFGSYIGASEFLDGALDEIRIWSVERTQTEIQDNRFVELTGSETGLIGYWKFNEGSGTTAYDSANGYDGSLNNMDPINSWILTCLIDDSQGSALDFDGIDDYVEIPDDNSLDLTTNYTIETWIKPESFSSLAGMVTKYHIAGSNGYLLRLHSDAPYTGFCFDEMYTSTGILEQDNWYHIAAVNDNGTRKIYLNGVEQTLTGTPLTVAANSDPVCLGVDYLDAGRYFNGDMDEVRIWNVARTRQEICQSMHSTLEGTESNLVSYFQFNEGEGDIAHDVVSGNNGLLNNMTNDDWIDSTVPFGETFGGTISSNTVWDAETIYIYDDVFINDGVTLTIDPGTTVMFQGYYKLDVQGRILAVGTGTDSIKFTADPSVNWQGIRFDSTPTTNDSTMFEYCLFENGIGPWTHNDKKGGSIYAGSFSKISINHCSFSNNYADLGGALSFYNSSPVITNSYFSGNSAQYGGAYYGSGSSASFLYCTFENNSAVANDYGYYGEGGAISCRYSGVMDISYCFFLDNTADNKGGAISLETSLILRSCVIANNTSGDTGGGFNCNGGSMSMYNCTITENVAQNYGSGINFESTSYPHLHNCIIYGNHADAGQISILDTDGAQYFHYCNIEGGFDAFIGAGSGVNFNGTYEFCIDSDPGFTDSSNNDYSLLNTSHCINGGNPGLPISLIGEFDLAGNNRIFDSSIGSDELNDALDRVDIGAYEYSSESGIIPAGTTIYHNQVINSNLYVLQDFTFTIAQGKTLEFDQGAGMFIYGSLDANGESYQLITFTASNESNGWSGLNFISSTGAAPTSNLEYCIIEYGDGETSGEQANGGNIFVKDYDEITLLNCRIKSGNAENGGSIYCENSKINLFNCILNNNQADQSGGAIFAHHSESSLINLTIVDNSAGTDGGGLAFSDELYSQPEIKNCIIWDNGIAPIIPGNGLLTDVAYCDIEYPYPGSNNISSDPVFTGEADNPYNIANYSYCLNAGVQDTTGLNLPAIDILGYPRIFGHTDPAYDRIDIGAYECQEIFAPFNFSASDGDNYFPGYVQLYWNYNPDYEPAPETFTIGRNGMPINVIDGQTYYYSDYTAVPGQVYSYQIAAIAGDQSNLSLEDSGYLKPNGIISGTVLSANNNPVQGVKISLDPSPGFCLEFDSSAPSSLTIENPEVNMDFNFTIEFWVKTALSDVILLNKGNHNFSVNASGKVEYTDGTNTIIQDSLSVNDNEWHHLAVVNDYTNSRTFLYFDEYKVASDTTFVFSGSSDAGFSTSTSFSGFLDNIIIWTAARDSSDIVEGMNIITAWDEPGLAGYWPLNEGIGTSVFDATNFAHNGSIIDCDWSFPDAGVLLGAFTDEWGNYIV